MSKLASTADLAAFVPSGSRLAIGGFQLNRAPMALLRALAGRGVADLDVVAAPNPLALDYLARHGCLRSVESGFIGFQYEDGFAVAPALRRAVAAGDVTLEQQDVYDTIAYLRTAASRAPEARRPDICLLHAQFADPDGNLLLADPHADPLLAAASTTVIATAEEIVDRVDNPTVEGDAVAIVAHSRGGAAPTGCYGHYRRAVEAIRAQIGAGPPVSDPRPAEEIDRLVVCMSRQVNDGEVVVTGLASALAMLAIQLARRTHAPAARYINCVGAVNPARDAALATSVDTRLLDDCDDTITLPEIFDLARDGGVDSMFFGAAQIDAAARINLTRIGPAENPKVRLPGPAGSPSMRSYVRRVIVTVPRQSKRNLVPQVDVATSVASDRNQETVLVTDLAVWRLTGGAFTPASLHAGVDLVDLAAHTGFEVASATPPQTSEPTGEEIAALNGLDPHGVRYQLLRNRPSYKNATLQPENDS